MLLLLLLWLLLLQGFSKIAKFLLAAGADVAAADARGRTALMAVSAARQGLNGAAPGPGVTPWLPVGVARRLLLATAAHRPFQSQLVEKLR